MLCISVVGGSRPCGGTTETETVQRSVGMFVSWRHVHESTLMSDLVPTSASAVDISRSVNTSSPSKLRYEVGGDR